LIYLIKTGKTLIAFLLGIISAQANLDKLSTIQADLLFIFLLINVLSILNYEGKSVISI